MKSLSFFSKTRVFNGSEVLTGQRKSSGFLKKPGLFFTFSKDVENMFKIIFQIRVTRI